MGEGAKRTRGVMKFQDTGGGRQEAGDRMQKTECRGSEAAFQDAESKARLRQLDGSARGVRASIGRRGALVRHKFGLNHR